MKQLTIRGFDAELRKRLQSLATTEGVSLNQAALRLMRRGAGLGPAGERSDIVGTSLDHLAGTWTAAEAREVEKAGAAFESVDDDLWGQPPPSRRSRRP
jgi:hypothetical protein